MPLATYKDLCIDAVDAERSARFWARLLDLNPEAHRDGVWRLDDPTGEPRVWVNPVPEPTTVKNRIHLDVNAEGLEAALAAGATVVDGDSFRWTVLRDPDGQEFCLFVREESSASTQPVWPRSSDTSTAPTSARARRTAPLVAPSHQTRSASVPGPKERSQAVTSAAYPSASGWGAATRPTSRTSRSRGGARSASGRRCAPGRSAPPRRGG